MVVLKPLSNRKPIHTTTLLFIGLFFSLTFAVHEVSAAEFKFQSNLISSVSSIRSTNQLAVSGNSTETESVLNFNPNTSLSISAKRANIIADFGVSHRMDIDTGFSTTIPEITLSALSRIYGNTYTVGAVASSLGRIEDANSSVDGTVEGSDEVPVINEFEFQQNAMTRIGSKAVLRAQHSSAISQSTLDSDIGSNSHTLEFESNALLTRTGLIGGVRGGYQFTDFENDTQEYAGVLWSELQIPVSAVVTMTTAAGYEWNRIDETESELAGEVLFLGFLWNPTARVSAELGYGRRVFGDSPRAKISYTARRSGFSLSWTRALQSLRLGDFGEGLDANAIDDTAIDAGTGSEDEVLNFNGLDSSSPFLSQQRDINEIVTLEMFFDTIRTRYSASFVYVENEILEESRVNGVSEITRFQAVRTFGQSLDIGLEAAFSSELDESDNTSTRQKISILSKWQF